MGPLLNIWMILSCIHPTFFKCFFLWSTRSVLLVESTTYWEIRRMSFYILSDKSAQTIYTLVKGLSFSFQFFLFFLKNPPLDQRWVWEDVCVAWWISEAFYFIYRSGGFPQIKLKPLGWDSCLLHRLFGDCDHKRKIYHRLILSIFPQALWLTELALRVVGLLLYL